MKKELNLANDEVKRLRELVTETPDFPEAYSTQGPCSMNKTFDYGHSLAADRSFDATSEQNRSMDMGKMIPKLNLSKVKKIREYKEWNVYAKKLEDSVKILRRRIISLENDNELLNDKYRHLKKKYAQLADHNQKLAKAVRSAKDKIQRMKDEGHM